MTVRLRVFGGLSITRDGEAVVGPAAQRRNLALLAVLAVHGRAGIPREKLSALLWPESHEGSARGSLKQTVFVIRRELGGDVVLGTTDLRCGTGFPASDLADFEAALERGELEQAVTAHTGPFLDGFHLSSASGDFERWVERERDRLARRCGGALEALATRAERSGDHAAAGRWWRQLAEGAPLDSRYTRGVIRAQAAMGDRAGALQFAELHRQLLKEELALPLDAELERLVATVRSAPPAPVAGAAPQADTPVLDAAVPDVSTRSASAAPRAKPWRSWRRGTVLAVGALGITAVSVLGSTFRGRSSTMAPRRVAVVATGLGQHDASTTKGTAQLLEAIARNLTTLQLTPVVSRQTSARDVTAVGRDAGARWVVSVALDGAGVAEAALTSIPAGEREWGIRAAAGDRAGADVLAERAATAVAVRSDSTMAGWIQWATEPSSIPAYRDFSRGLTRFADNQKAAAVESFLLAAQRDTTFTLPLVLAGLVSTYEGRLALADSIATALRGRDLSSLERGMLDVQAAILSTNLDAEYRAAASVAAAAPGSEWSYLLADVALKLGRGSEARRVVEGMGLERGWLRGSTIAWFLLGRALHHSGEHERELAAMAEARRRFPTDRIVAQGYLKALAARGDVDVVLTEIDRVLTFPQRGNWGDHQPMSQTIAELWAHGHHDGARHATRRTLEWLARQDAATRGEWAVVIPTYLYYAGDLSGARERLNELRRRGPLDATNLALSAVIAAVQGDRATAVRIAEGLSVHSDPAARVETLVTRAGIAASLGDRELAVGLLRDACRAGFAWRTVLHILPGFDALAGFAPFEELVHPAG